MQLLVGSDLAFWLVKRYLPALLDSLLKLDPRVQVRNPGLKSNQAAAQKRAQVSVTAATSSMRSSKSWTRTRRNSGNNLSAAPEIFGAAGTTTNQRSDNNNLWQQLT